MRRTWKSIGILALFLMGLAFVLDALGASSITVLDDAEKSALVGGANCKCRKSNACGSVYCKYISGSNPKRWENCSKDTEENFCVTGTSGQNCDTDGESVPCGKFQKCDSSSCDTCTPAQNDCNRTSAGTDDDDDDC